MKKVFYVISGILAVLLLAMVLIPMLFKDQIRQAVDKELEGAVNAKIYYNPDKFGLSFFRQFPNLTVSLGEFGIAGIGVFEGDTLVDVRSFDLTINVASLFGKQITIKKITLDQPVVELLVLSDGTSNWDIALPDTAQAETPEVETEESPFALRIDKWQIKDGKILFNDLQSDMLAIIESLNHTGSGDIGSTLYDLTTNTLIKGLTYEMAGTKYLTKAELEADLILTIDMAASKYTFKENFIRLNDFKIAFEGSVAMPEDSTIVLDMNFGAKETQFKNILSLIPGVFMEGFENIKTSGELAFQGNVKGIYKDSTQMPAFGMQLQVKDGMFQYPDLPTPVSNIQVDMSMGTTTGQMEQLTVDIRKFHLDLGSNPVEFTLSSEGLMPVTVNAMVAAKVDLEEALKVFPVEGLAMKGLFELNAKANGTYSETSMPALTATMALSNGYAKSADFPAPIEALQMKAKAGNPTGANSDFIATVDEFSMQLEGERIDAKLDFANLDDYTYNLDIKGSADLEKITKIFPLEGMKLAGKIAADIKTAGKMSDIDAERYDKLPTSGTLSATAFFFESADLPQGFKIDQANMRFDPRQMILENFTGSIGKSDLKLTGFLSNYIGFAMKEGEVIKGKLNFNSKRFDVNEWMTEEGGSASGDSTVTAATTADTLPMSVVLVPKTIDFILNSSIDKVLYSNMEINNLAGSIKIKDGKVRLENTRMNTLGGNITMDGFYDSYDPAKPSYDFNLKVDKMAIAKAYETFAVIKAMAPIAKGMKGDFSTDFRIKGDLDQTMMPIMPSLTGGGNVQVQQASVSDLKLMNGIADVTKMNDLRELKLHDVLMQAEIRDGRVFLKPFTVQAGSTAMNISGSSGLDQTMDFDILLPNVKTGVVGQAVNAALSGLFGGNAVVSDAVDITLKALGPFSDPRVTIASIKPVGGGAAPKNIVNDQVNKVKEDAERRLREEQERLRKETEDRARQEQERIKREAEERLKKEAEDAKKKLKDRFGIPK